MWNFYDDSGDDLTSCGINSSNFTLVENLAVTGGFPGCGIGYLHSPSSGTQTFDWNFAGTDALGEGSLMVIYFFDGVETSGSPFRDTGTDSDDSTNSVSVTVTSTTDDLIIACGQSFTGTSPNLSYVTVHINNNEFNNEVVDAGTAAGSATSSTASITSANFSSIVVGSLKEPAAAAAPFLPYHSKSRFNVKLRM